MPYNTICYQKLSESKPSMTTLGICRCGGNQTSQDLMRLLNVFPMCCGAALKVFSMCWVWLKIMSHVFFCGKTSVVEKQENWLETLSLVLFFTEYLQKGNWVQKNWMQVSACYVMIVMIYHHCAFWYIFSDMLYSDHIWRYQRLICYILITSGDTKGCHGLSVEPSAPKQKNSCRIHLYIPGSRSVRWFYSYKMFWTYKMLCLG